jgi:hypothetical protein
MTVSAADTKAAAVNGCQRALRFILVAGQNSRRIAGMNLTG